MVAPPTSPVIVRRLQNRYKPSVKAFICSLDDWDKFYRYLTPTVQELYQKHGFYDIDQKGHISRTPATGNLGVIALTWKGLPLVSYVDASRVLMHFGRKDVVIL